MAEEHLGVVVLGIGQDPLAGGILHDSPVVHDQDPLGGLEDHTEVVADQDGGEALLFLQLSDGPHHLMLDQDVQSGGRLVEDHELGLQGQCQGYGDPLPHAARQFARVGVENGVLQTYLLYQLPGMGLVILLLHIPVGLVDVHEVLADGPHWVQGVHARLKDHGESATPLPTKLLLAEGGNVFATKKHTPLADPGRRLGESCDGEAQGGLARPRLPNQAHEFTLIQRKTHVLDRLDRFLVGAVIFDGQVLDT